MSRKIQFISLLVFAGLFLTASQPGFAQSVNGPLNFGNNYFVTGDYVVGGAQGMTSNIAGGYAAGTIAIPDGNPGITGAKAIPPGAEVVAALLYWQTVEKTGTVPGQAGSGENGYFMPVGVGGPNAPGYPITGVDLASNDTVAFSSSGCTSTSTGQVVRTYRANVLAALPRDSTGNISANGIYAVYLPSVRNSTPLTLGASLVLIYRVLSPTVPLNSIVIYDGAYAPTTSSPIMQQKVQGFYDAATGPVSRLTEIVGQGKINKLETVYLNNSKLPSLYGSEPSFPGYYGSWDNPTWTFNPTESYVRVANPITAGAASATTEVTGSSQGCVSWGAVIVSTTVVNSDGDGLLDSWKVKPTGYANPGYCDASVNEGVCTPGSASWVDLPGAVHGEKDVFIQLDYMCSSPIVSPPGVVDSCTTGDGTNYSFDPRLSGAVGLLTNAFNPPTTPVHPAVHLHINPTGTNQPDIHAMPESACTDNTSTTPPGLCSFPGQPGVVAWKGGFDFIKNQLVDSSGQTSDCTTTTPAASCKPRFQPGKRTSWHYVLSAHAVGQPQWNLQNDSLEYVKQSGNTVTFTTGSAVGTIDQVVNAQGSFSPDPTCPYGRVTILGAASNPNLNGTFCLKSAANPTGTSFTITVGGPATIGIFTYNSDPNLAVAPGFTTSASGVSDVGGADSLITLGLWGNPAFNGVNHATVPASDGQSEPVLAGTVMHELGHSIGLTHGGYTYPLLALGDYVPTLGPNCKPNFQSVMNYLFQVDLLSPSPSGSSNVPDYSGQILASLNEAKAGAAGVLANTSYLNTSWYTPYTGVGSPITIHCDGSPNTNGASMSHATGLTGALSWSADQDINFDGSNTETLQGYNDWANIDLRQIGATGTNSTAEGGGQNFGGGGQNLGGGGQSLGGGGQSLGGGGQSFGGGGQSLGGGGQSLGGGGQSLGGGGEVSSVIANSVTRPPRSLMASEAASPRTITLTWLAPTFGQIGAYNVYQQAARGGAFSKIGSVTGNPPALSFAVTDTLAPCNTAGYEYFVTAVLASPMQESVGSNTVTTQGTATGQGLITGCYTNTPPTVALNNLTVTTASVVQGSPVPITWSLQDDYNTTATYVSRLQASSLVAIGPFQNDGSCPTSLPSGGTTTTVLTNGVASGSSTFVFSNNQFTFNWDTTPFNAGCYFFKLTLDSSQTETTTSALTVLIYVSDAAPHVTTTTLPAGTVGQAYSNTIYEAGGVAPFTWSTPGPLPTGITLGAATGMLSGTTCVANNYNFSAKVTDSKSNFGAQSLMLQIQQEATTTSVGSSLNPVIYGQPVTYTATVKPTYGCPMTGTVTFYDGGTGNPISGAIPLTVGTTVSTASHTPSLMQLMVVSHTITAVYTGDSNFVGSTSSALSQTVNKAAPTTSVAPSTNPSTYGQAVTFTATVAPPYGGTPTGSVTFYDSYNGATATAISSAIGLSSGSAMFTTTNLQLMAGAHSITAVYTGDSNFYATGAGGSTATVLPQMVNPAPLTVTAMGVNKMYDETQTAQVTLSDNRFPDAFDAVFTDSATATFATKNVGTGIMVSVTGITISGQGASNYVLTSTTASTIANISPAPLTITVTGTQVYGGMPSYTPSALPTSGLQGNDSLSNSVTGMLTSTSCSTTAVASSPVVYSLGYTTSNCMGLTALNYTITYAYVPFTITAAPLTVMATGVGKQYDGTTFATVVLSDNRIYPMTDTFTDSYTTAMFYSADVGIPILTPVPINVTGIAISPGPGATNYKLANVGWTASASAIISQYPLTVTPTGVNKVYDGTTAATVTFGDNRPPAGTDPGDAYNSAAFASPNIGTGIAVSVNGISASSADYAVQNTTANTTANITPAPLTVSVSGSESVAPPTFTTSITPSSYSGFVPGETSSVVNGTLSCDVVVPLTGGTAGSYPISCTGLSAANYNITYAYSGFTAATPATLTVNVFGTETGGPPPTAFAASSYTLSGLLGTDTSSVVTGTLSCSVLAEDSSSNYPISCTGLSTTGASNSYDIAYNYSYGTVTPPNAPTPLTVAVSGSVKLGGTPTFAINSITYSGFLNGNTPSVVSGALSCTVAVPATALSKYPITCLGLTANSYNVSYDYTNAADTTAAATSPLIVNVTATQPAVTYSVSGLVKGNAPSVVTGTISCTTSTTADTSGNYPISCSGLSATNYAITYSYAPGIGPTSVSSAPLSLAVTGTVPTGGGGSPTLTITSVTYTGFVNGDTLSAITGPLSCTVTPGATAIAPYKISNCTGLTAPGYYTFYYLTGKITTIASD